MDPKDLCEHTRIRLIAAALGHQQCTGTAANLVPIPGGERVIVVGTQAEVRALLPKPEMPPELKAAIEEAAKTRSPGAVLPDGSAVFINYGDQPEDTEHLNCTACGGSGHIDDQLAQQPTLPEDVAALFGACGFEIRSTDPAEKHPLAVCGSLDAAGLVVETLMMDQPRPFDFHAHLARQAAWSEKTFGPGARTAGVCDHIRKELLEIEDDPLDLREWIDVVILALDGAWRCGGTPQQIIEGIVAKQTKNEGRTWPDWRTADPDKAIEHDRTQEGAAS